VNLQREIEKAIHFSVTQIEPLSGGCVGQVYRVSVRNGPDVVAKLALEESAMLDREGYMLTFLSNNSDLPVPEVLYCSKKLLLLSFIPGESRFSKQAEEHAAELLAALHMNRGPAFGLDQDTLIGGLQQPNPWTTSWVEFFGRNRLMFMATEGMRMQRLPRTIYDRIELFCEQLDSWLEEPDYPALIHGDAWTANILADNGRISGFIDPAIYYADPEIELAFTTLFGTFGDAFLGRYQETMPLKPGFFEERCDIYNLYPLLVHVRLFGGSYVQSVDATLRRFGF